MASLKGLGKVLILAYYLILFTSMLQHSKSWETKLLFLFSQCSIGLNKATGLLLPITGKFVMQISGPFLEATGTLGILLTFAGFYNNKPAIRVLLLGSLLVTVVSYLPISIINYKSINSELIRALQQLSTSVGLLWFID